MNQAACAVKISFWNQTKLQILFMCQDTKIDGSYLKKMSFNTKIDENHLKLLFTDDNNCKLEFFNKSCF